MAKRAGKNEVPATNAKPTRYAYAPLLYEFRKHTKKTSARNWLPIENSLLVRYEFASCSLQTRYIFVAILLYCAGNGVEEIPLDATFLASVLVADKRTIEKSLRELLSKDLLREREKDREKKNRQTDNKATQKNASREGVVSVNSVNLLEEKSKASDKSPKADKSPKVPPFFPLILAPTAGHASSITTYLLCTTYHRPAVSVVSAHS